MGSVLFLALFINNLDQNEVKITGKVADVREYNWKFDKSPGIIVTVPLDPNDFPKGTPEHMRFRLELGRLLKRFGWEIIRVDGWEIHRVFAGHPDSPPRVIKQEMEFGPSLSRDETDLADRVVFLRRLKTNQEYVFEIYLHRKTRVDNATVRSVVEKMKTDSSFKATYVYKKD